MLLVARLVCKKINCCHAILNCVFDFSKVFVSSDMICSLGSNTTLKNRTIQYCELNVIRFCSININLTNIIIMQDDYPRNAINWAPANKPRYAPVRIVYVCMYNLYFRLRNTEQHGHTVLGSIDNL